MATRVYGKGGVLYFLKDGDSVPSKVNYSDWEGSGNHVTVIDASRNQDKGITVAIADVRDESGVAVGTQTMKDILEHLGTEKGK